MDLTYSSMPKTSDVVPLQGDQPLPALDRNRPDLRHALQMSTRIMAVLVIMALFVGSKLPGLFLIYQDLPVVGLMMMVFAVLARRWPVGALQPAATGDLELSRVALLGIALLATGMIGHYLVMWGYAFSRDEQMVLFDAEVFSHGQIVARLPAEWKSLHRALNTLFVPTSFNGAGWISIYRPGNAVLHALVGFVGDPAWTNPLLAVVGLVATWHVARRFLPHDRQSQFVAVLLYATSTQVMALAMTSYAMTGYLAFNMVWLALFLHDKWYTHVAALMVGALAIGYCRIPYFPLFAGPILFFCLTLQRRWGWSALYAAAYAAAIVFWAKYSVYSLRQLGVHAAPSEGDRFLLTRFLWAFADLSPDYLWNQAANLVRLLVWQNLLLLPLQFVGVRACLRSGDRRLWGMVAAIAILIVFKLILRPYQGHGWGYRYMHGILGIACLIAAIGWRDLRAQRMIGWRHLQIGTAATLLIATPFLLWQAHQFSGLFARQDRAIAAIHSDVVIVEDGAAEFSQDLVYNPPYLDRRPIRLLASKLHARDMARVCAGRSVAFFDAEKLAEIAAAIEQQRKARGPIAIPPCGKRR